MRRIFYFIVTLIALFYIDNAFALCSNSEKALYKKIVSNINVSYDYQMFYTKPIFDITFSNVVNVYMTDDKGYKYYPDSNNQVFLKGRNAGENIRVNFYSNASCIGDQIGSLYAQTPTYNYFYNLAVCENAREYSLCQKWVKHGLSEADFIKNVKNYIEERDSKSDAPIKTKFSIFEFILSLFSNIWFYVILIPIVIFVVIKLIKRKKDRDSFGF